MFVSCRLHKERKSSVLPSSTTCASKSDAHKHTETHTRHIRRGCLGGHLVGREHAILDRHVGDEVDEAGRVAPLVVVPRHELDKGGGEHDAGGGVEDGGAGLADKVGGDDGVLGVADDALGVRLRGELHLGLEKEQKEHYFLTYGGNGARHMGKRGCVGELP